MPLGVVGASGLVDAVAAALEDVPDLIGAQVRVLRQDQGRHAGGAGGRARRAAKAVGEIAGDVAFLDVYSYRIYFW